jgi:hypothetical protein
MSSEMPEGFQEYMDNKTGRKYYYNAETKETKWATEGLWGKISLLSRVGLTC